MDLSYLDKQIIKNRKYRERLLREIEVKQEDVLACRSKAEEKKYSISSSSLKDIKVAAIMDRFTLECFEPECNLLQLTPMNWKSEMENFIPDILFIESAWRGKDDLWTGKINHCSLELQELTDYCHQNDIPVIFWNKEDPIYTDTFMPTARRADFIFTTDMDCIQKYKIQCKHDRVYHLHFGAQPKTHNPIEKYERKNKLCFAGAYYTRYPERCKVFNDFSEVFIAEKGMDIYDRNYNDTESEYKFPDCYQPYILGTLDPSEIDIAYKGYLYGVNMNSVSQSQTMFARRVFELLASNTVVVGNYSRGVKNYFGDLTICTNDKATLKKNVQEYCTDANTLDKYRLLGLRKVLSEHLMEDRFRYVVNKVSNGAFNKIEPMVHVFGWPLNVEEANRIIRSYNNQTYLNKKLYLIASDDLILNENREEIEVISPDDLQNIADQCQYVSYFCAQDWYGANYLVDFMLATRYMDADAYCKSEKFVEENDKILIVNRGKGYRNVLETTLRSAMFKPYLLNRIKVSDIDKDYDIGSLTNSIFAVDRFNYCENFSENNVCELASDLTVYDQGLSINKINEVAEKIHVPMLDESSKCLDYKDLLELDLRGDSRILLNEIHRKVKVTSELPENTHGYFYINTNIAIGEYIKDGRLTIMFNGESSMNIMGVAMLLNQKGEKIEVKTIALNRKLVFENISDDAMFVRVGYRLRESGFASLTDILIGENYRSSIVNGGYLSRSDTLILTNHYPSADDLYKNAFVQTRVQGYKSEGYLVDVMRMYPYSNNGYREYAGINITEGHEDTLDSILCCSNINTVCVHFLDFDMWKVLKQHLSKVHLIIWSHGADIKPWWRREFNFTPETIEKGKEQSENRMMLWKEVFNVSQSNNIEFVFVSQSFADEVHEDYHLKEGDIKYHVIHNFIDTDEFRYEKKDAEQRKHILTIKSFLSSKYGNDLTANAIVCLSKKNFFRDLEFDIYGQGELFDEVNEPLKRFDNVHLHNTFLTKEEIVECHKTHGVYIATTRSDTQGVSRDEAMSSGLVPIANAVTAIPEFVDEKSGYLVPGEDYEGIADAIEEMYYNPDIFEAKSEAAAKKVRGLSDRSKTIVIEIDLIFN